jgi:hypothetical protein
VLSLLGGAAAVGELPFAWYRFSQGQVAAGIVDMGIATVLIGVVTYAWRGGSVEVASRICVVTSTVGCIGVSYLVGLAVSVLTDLPSSAVIVWCMALLAIVLHLTARNGIVQAGSTAS